MRIETEDFFIVLFEINPRFNLKVNKGPWIDPKTGEPYETDFSEVVTLYYKDYDSVDKFQFLFYQKARDILFDLKNDFANNKINKNVIHNYLERINSTMDLFYEVTFEGQPYMCPKQYIIIDGYAGSKFCENYEELVEPMVALEFFQYNHIRYELLTFFNEELQKILDSQPLSFTGQSKLQTNISVSDITLLFRLLDENKLLNYKHKTEIYRFIANNLRTEKQDNISEASIKNKFISPDNTALKNMKIILTNLKITLNELNQ